MNKEKIMLANQEGKYRKKIQERMRFAMKRLADFAERLMLEERTKFALH
jgi:hypothetical protein